MCSSRSPARTWSPPAVVPASGRQLALRLDEDDDSPAAASSARPRRIAWARLLARVFGGRTPTVDDLRQLPYTRQVIKETLRP